jgi:hypothetical protein
MPSLVFQMTQLYGIDPRISVNLCQSPFVPTPLQPQSEEFLRHIIATVLSRAEEGSVAVPGPSPPPAGCEGMGSPVARGRVDTSLDEVCHGVAQVKISAGLVRGVEAKSSVSGADEKELEGTGVEGVDEEGEEDKEVEEALADDTEERMRNNFWCVDYYFKKQSRYISF